MPHTFTLTEALCVCQLLALHFENINVVMIFFHLELSSRPLVPAFAGGLIGWWRIDCLDLQWVEANGL